MLRDGHSLCKELNLQVNTAVLRTAEMGKRRQPFPEHCWRRALSDYKQFWRWLWGLDQGGHLVAGTLAKFCRAAESF